MKHFLFLPLIIFSVACNNNSTSTNSSVRQLPFDNSAFLSISHQEDQSILRRKLQNFSLNAQIKKSVEDHTELDPDTEIKNADEFKFTDDSFKESSVNLAEYKKMKANAAEVIVSYKDHLEIYFVPTGIARDKAFSELRVVTEPEANFYWVNSTDNLLVKNKTYYLLNATKDNLKDNDIYFNQQKLALGADFNDKILSFSSNQILELEINIDYSLKETGLSLRGGQAYTCNHNLQEAGGCGSCEFKIEALNGNLIKQQLENTDLVDLELIINGKKYHLNELGPEKMLNGNFKVFLNLKKLIKEDTAIVQIYKSAEKQILKTVQAVEMGFQCMHKNVSDTIDITPLVKLNLEMTVKGRVLNF